ncbi:MAG: 2-oxoacid:acceptor oxidoreductase family protein [Anaerolineae bacterium]|nr:2-oxoacid:acceptor oxidoreductase family protein [Anaerolineae bacterium]
MTAITRTTYLDETTLPFPFCPGCGHSAVLQALDSALTQLQPDPQRVVLVSDIGCQGLSDKFFVTNAFHGLHGRSVTYATGIKLANPDLDVIVLIGDGGCGIGGHHLINAARRNIGITVLVFNNLNFGMTGGEHSVTTPSGAITSTTRHGNLERPLDICSTVAVNGANLVARTTVFDSTLPDVIAGAIQYDGFALVDIWELCTAYFAANNQFRRKSIEDTLAHLDFATGIIQQRDQPEYSRSYRTDIQHPASQENTSAVAPRPLETRYASSLAARQHWIIAGAAGQKTGSAASAFCRGAIMSGLWTTQHNDYPVTVKSGHSVAEVIVSPEPIRHIGIDEPDVMVILFEEGLHHETARLAQLSDAATVYINADLLPVETRARTVALDFSQTGQRKLVWTLMGLAAVLQHTEIYPLSAFKDAVSHGAYADKNLAAIAVAEKVIITAC